MGQVKATKKNKTRAQLASCPHGHYRGHGWRGLAWARAWGKLHNSKWCVGRGAWRQESHKQRWSAGGVASEGRRALGLEVPRTRDDKSLFSGGGSGGGGIGGGSRGSGSGGGSGGSGSGGSGGSGRGSGTLMEPIYGSVHSGGVGVGLGKTCCRPQQKWPQRRWRQQRWRRQRRQRRQRERRRWRQRERE